MSIPVSNGQKGNLAATGVERRRLILDFAAKAAAGRLRQFKETGRAVRACLMLFLCLALPAPVLPGQSPPALETTGRYLFIVDTSSAMRPRARAVEKTVDNLMRSIMPAELRRGDTIGLWTFNTNLVAGRFPLQRWTPETAELTASNVLAFLKTQRYAGSSRLDRVWPALQQVVAQSGRLTVLLISDGAEKFSGTPFDREINGDLQQYFRAQQVAKMPFITVLRAQQGQFVRCSLNLAPSPVEFPKFPPEPKIAEAPKLEPLPVPEKKETQPTTPRVIIIGNKPETNQAPPVAATNTPAAAESPPARVMPEPAAVPTPAKPTEPANAAEAAKPVAAEPTPLPQPASAPTQPAKSEPGIAAAAKPAETPTPPAAPAASEPAVKVEIAPSPKPVETTPPAAAKPTEPSAPAVPLKVEAAATVPPAPDKRIKDTSQRAAATPQTVATSAVLATPPAQVATATLPDSGSGRFRTLAIGGACLLLAAGLCFLMLRRGRVAPHASLITRSMDKDEK